MSADPQNLQQQPQPSVQQHQTLLRSLRFVEEICFLLKLPRPCTKTALDYYYQLSNSKTHEFQIEIMMAASIFLASKIFEQSRKIRDILNMIFSVTSLHRIMRVEQQQEGGEAIASMMRNEQLKEAIQPNYSINNYNDFKSKILQAQQHLLRIIAFDFKHSQINLTEIKSLLVLIHQLRLPPTSAQIILNAYNDLPFTGIEKWIPGVIYFGYLAGNIAMKLQNRMEQEFKLKDSDWEMLFPTKIQKLRTYAAKIASHYQQKHHPIINQPQNPAIDKENQLVSGQKVQQKKVKQVNEQDQYLKGEDVDKKADEFVDII